MLFKLQVVDKQDSLSEGKRGKIFLLDMGRESNIIQHMNQPLGIVGKIFIRKTILLHKIDVFFTGFAHIVFYRRSKVQALNLHTIEKSNPFI